ncbi:mitochondrial carrier protein, putative [Bodo saltans]|uniref:Mitochondrial carrier protein, putative n=1 Tax=Bodo saltans TaxID=75058 RepID=A0A0S4IR49_BODSA|nr:mitochondrial carrier protein, putative [Bodo saltans]|eukprot:CUG00161.1 mitochondrial carrier protein, putative [Bodo saltans]
MHGAAHDQGSSSSSPIRALVFGPGGAATLAGAMEISIFHPFDTISKRLMSNEHRVIGSSVKETMNNFTAVAFKGLKTQPGVRPTFLQRVQHLYPGSLFAVYYKVSQRFVKFAGQPYAKDYLEKHKEQVPMFRNGKRGQMLMEATAGCLVGVSEVVLLPFDRLKVLSQTNQAALQGRGMISIFVQEGPRKMYAGLVITATRNAPGSFLLFGGTALTKEYAFGLKDYRSATFLQNVAASTVGAMMGVFVTSPIDVLKTRVQNKGFGEKMTAWQAFTNIMKVEGPHAFFKGITPKMIATSPRLVFSYTLSQYFTRMLRGLDPERKKTVAPVA